MASSTSMRPQPHRGGRPPRESTPAIVPLITDAVDRDRLSRTLGVSGPVVGCSERPELPLPPGVYWCHRPRDEAAPPAHTRPSRTVVIATALVEIDGFDEVMAALDEDMPRVPSTSRSGLVAVRRRSSASSSIRDDDVDWDLVERRARQRALGPGWHSLRRWPVPRIQLA